MSKEEYMASIMANPSIRNVWYNAGKSDEEITEDYLLSCLMDEAEIEKYHQLDRFDEMVANEEYA